MMDDIIIYSKNGYWVSNEGNKSNPRYHVWIPDLTHSVCDSAYDYLDLAISRCNYLEKNKITLPYRYAIKD